MDALLSLPIASYFLAPSLTSWSTSLNLLFFYMTWSTLVLSHPPLRIHLIALLAVRTALFLVPALLFLGFDVLLPGLSASIKLSGDSALPPRSPERLARRLGLAVFNLLLVTGVECGLSYLFQLGTGDALFRTSTTLPLPWHIIRHLGMLFAAREVLHYYLHRFVLHAKQANMLSRQHNAYAHQHASAPHTLQRYADHPLPLLASVLIPTLLPACLLRPHLLTYLLFTMLVTVEETFAMSGYTAVPGILMGGITRRTALHYASRGRSNYGPWGFLDWINGTSKGQDILDDVKGEADKHRVQDRARNKVDEGRGLLAEGVDAWRQGNGVRKSPRKRTVRRAD